MYSALKKVVTFWGLVSWQLQRSIQTNGWRGWLYWGYKTMPLAFTTRLPVVVVRVARRILGLFP